MGPCNMRMNGTHRPVKLPPHTGPELTFTNSISFQQTLPRQYNYVFPLNKYTPMMFQPGPVYQLGEAAAIGHQPFNYRQGVWTAFSTPAQMDYAYKHGFRGTQSAPSYSLAQQTMSQLLSLRSINSGG